MRPLFCLGSVVCYNYCSMEDFDTDKFICTIQNCPELWNKCAKEHADKSKRETAWNAPFSRRELLIG